MAARSSAVLLSPAAESMQGQSSSVIGARPNGPSDDSMNGDRENMICDVLDVGQDNGITVEFWAQF